MEPIVIKKAPNCTDKNRSKHAIMTLVRISFGMKSHRPQWHIRKLKP